MGGGEAGEEESEATDSRRPSLPQPQAEAKREEEGMTEIERIIKKEQEVNYSQLVMHICNTEKLYVYIEVF